MAASRKTKSLKDTLGNIKKELKALDQFRSTKQLEEFRRKLVGEYSFVKRQIERTKQNERTIIREKKERLQKANKNRSEKNRRTWRYVKSIQENYAPDKSVKEIRSLLKKRKEGLQVEIPDVAWRNPSP